MGPELAGMMAARRQVGRAAAGQHHLSPVVGLEVSPKTLNDAWITSGMARYGELILVGERQSAMKAGLQDGRRRPGLRHHPVSSSRLGPFSPEFQSMTLEKGAMIFHMLLEEIGDKAFSLPSRAP
jgi:hypothetical protein